MRLSPSKYKEHTAQNLKGPGAVSAPGTQGQGSSGSALKITNTTNVSAISPLRLISPQNNWKTASQSVIPHTKVMSPQLLSLSHPSSSVTPKALDLTPFHLGWNNPINTPTAKALNHSSTQLHAVLCGDRGVRSPAGIGTASLSSSISELYKHLTKLPTSGQKSLSRHQLSPSRRRVLGMVSHKSPRSKGTGCVLTTCQVTLGPGGWG